MLDWKCLQRKNALAYLASLSVMKKKGFLTLSSGVNVINLSFHCYLHSCQNKLDHLSLTSLFSRIEHVLVGCSLPLVANLSSPNVMAYWPGAIFKTLFFISPNGSNKQEFCSWQAFPACG
jgi:hypothetical protein